MSLERRRQFGVKALDSLKETFINFREYMGQEAACEMLGKILKNIREVEGITYSLGAEDWYKEISEFRRYFEDYLAKQGCKVRE